jgi:hypothetical protein
VYKTFATVNEPCSDPFVFMTFEFAQIADGIHLFNAAGPAEHSYRKIKTMTTPFFPEVGSRCSFCHEYQSGVLTEHQLMQKGLTRCMQKDIFLRDMLTFSCISR